MEYGAIILAAGASTRMGTSKQLLKIGDQSLIRKTTTTVLSAGINHVVVVLGANATRHEEEIKDLATTIIVNPNWVSGIGSSIKVGVEELIKTKLDGLFILVCDQPFLTEKHLAELIKKYEAADHPIIASQYADTIGVPALFSYRVIPTLLALGNEEGAKKVILTNSHLVLPFEGGEVDLDTMEDYNHIIKTLK